MDELLDLLKSLPFVVQCMVAVIATSSVVLVVAIALEALERVGKITGWRPPDKQEKDPHG